MRLRQVSGSHVQSAQPGEYQAREEGELEGLAKGFPVPAHHCPTRLADRAAPLAMALSLLRERSLVFFKETF